MKYVFVFNPRAKRYRPEAEAIIISQATRILRRSTIEVVHTLPELDDYGQRFVIPNFATQSADADCVVAVGGDGTVNIVVSAMMRCGLSLHTSLGVIPYGTGNNLVRSFGLDRDGEKALHIIQQGHTIPLDIGCVNRSYYCINTSFGLFPYLVARRVTRSLVGWTYDAVRHLGFSPWPLRLRYTDVAGRDVEIPSQRYIVGALLNTSHYGSILRMAPDVVSDDRLFDVKLIRETPKVAYPLVFTMLLTGQYDLSKYTTTFRASRMEVIPDTICHFETDGDVIPPASHYTVEMAGQIRLCVPFWR